MPCFSTIQKTAITDRELLKDSLIALGFKIHTDREDYVEASGNGFIGYYRQADGTWSVGTFGQREVTSKIGKEYAKRTVQKFAKTGGYRYQEDEQKNQITITMGRRY